MIYAQIKGGVVLNIIELNDIALISIFTLGFDSLIRVDSLVPYPSPGWSYDGTNFTPPGAQ